MDRNLLCIFAAAGLCLCAVNAHVQRRYHFVYDFMNMTEAQSYCREKYSDLATVESEEDMELLRNMADLSRMKYPGGNSDRAWIGLYDDISSWRWSLLERSFYKPGETEFRNWWPGEPNNVNGREHCVELYDNGQWNDDSCDTQLQPVCCNVTGSDVTFVLINTSMSWTEAQSYCRNHHTDLAWVKNTTDNQRVKDLVSGQKVWIGLSRESWKWSDGSQSTFRFWKQESKEPNNNFENETCVSADFSSSGRWEDWNCDYKRTFVCQSVPTASKRVMKVGMVKEKSLMDLNDPAVMDNILKKVQQNLKDQGFGEDLKLSWRKQPDGKVFHQEKKEKKRVRTGKDEL